MAWTTCVGRIEEISALKDALASNGCAQVVGPPGVGKSTVLMQLQPTWVVDLSDCDRAEDIMLWIARALDIPTRRDVTDWRERLARQIADVFEHADDACLVLDQAGAVMAHLGAMISPWLAHIQVAIGSRVQGAPSIPVVHLTPWLDAPKDQHHPGVALFLSKASMGQQWANDPTQLDAVCQIVEQLQGVALAITLVAARASMFTPTQLLVELNTSSTTQDRVTRRLEQTLQWSWALLDSNAQDVLIQCALFQGQFARTLVSDVSQEDVEPLLAQLLAHGWLAVDKDTSQLSMLAYIQSFLKQYIQPLHLQRHIKQMVEIARIVPEVTYLDPWHSALPIELAPQWWHVMDLLTGDASISVGDDTSLTLMIALYITLAHTSDAARFEQLEASFEQVLAQAQGEPAFWLRLARCHASAMLVGTQTGGEQALALLAELPEGTPLLTTLTHCACCHYAARHMDDLSRLEQWIESTDKPLLQMMLWRSHGIVLLSRGQSLPAIESCQKALALARQLGEQGSVARIQMRLGSIYLRESSLELGLVSLREAISLFNAQGHILGLSYAQTLLVWTYLDKQDFTTTTYYLNEALSHAHQWGLIWQLGMLYLFQGQLLLAQQHFTEAAIALERALRHLEASGPQQMVLATQAYVAINDGFLGQWDAFAHRSAVLFDAYETLRTPTSRMIVLGLRLIVETRQRAWDNAQLLVEQLRQLAHPDSALLQATRSVFEAHLYGALWVESPEDIEQKRALIDAIKGLYQPEPMIELDISTRICFDLLGSRMPPSLWVEVLREIQDLDQNALLVDAEARRFRPPGQLCWFTFGHKPILNTLFFSLVTQRIEHDLEPIPFGVLLQTLWPDEQMTADAAQNRLHVALSSLRHDGALNTCLVRVDDGYRLDVPVIMV